MRQKQIIFCIFRNAIDHFEPLKIPCNLQWGNLMSFRDFRKKWFFCCSIFSCVIVPKLYEWLEISGLKFKFSRILKTRIQNDSISKEWCTIAAWRSIHREKYCKRAKITRKIRKILLNGFRTAGKNTKSFFGRTFFLLNFSGFFNNAELSSEQSRQKVCLFQRGIHGTERQLKKPRVSQAWQVHTWISESHKKAALWRVTRFQAGNTGQSTCLLYAQDKGRQSEDSWPFSATHAKQIDQLHAQENATDAHSRCRNATAFEKTLNTGPNYAHCQRRAAFIRKYRPTPLFATLSATWKVVHTPALCSLNMHPFSHSLALTEAHVQVI